MAQGSETVPATLRINGEPSRGCELGRLLGGFERLTREGALAASLGDCNSLVLETKYYRATVAIEYGSGEGSEVGAHLEVLSASAANESPAALPLPAPADDDAVPVRLLVVTKRTDEAPLSEEARYACAVWALEHSSEFIDIDLDSLTETWNEREKEGLPRLVEALQANMWAGMQRKESAASQSAPADTLPAPVPAPAPDLTSAAPAPPLAPTASAVSASTASPAPAAADAAGLSDEERLLEGFSDMIANARAMRESAVAGKLSDEERRERAAAFALQFSAMLSEGDDSEEDEG